MAIYPGRRAGTHRIVLWAKNKSHEWIVEGSKAEARTWEAKKQLELGASVDPAAMRTALAFEPFCVERYKPHAIAHLKDSTWRKVRRYQLETLIEHFGAVKLNRFDLATIEAFKTARLATGKVGAASVNNELRLLKTILRWAASLGFDVKIPAFKRLPIRGRPRVKAWSLAELGALFAAVKAEAPELEPMLTFLANTGCRKGEALAAERPWVDLAAGLVRIPSNDYWQPKSGKPREIPISKSLRPYLRRALAGGRWLFPNSDGQRFADFPKEPWWRCTARAGLTGGPHQLRHTFASMFLQRVPDLFLLAQVLGQSTIRVTELYTHLLPGHLDRARNAVDISPAEVTKKRTMVRAMAKRRK